jgi:hypothetical protein
VKKATQAEPKWLFGWRALSALRLSGIQTAELASPQALTAASAALKVALGRMMAASLAWSGM